MKPPTGGHGPSTARMHLSVHAWRVAQLTRVGIAMVVAEAHADHLDWHQIAELVQHGCPPLLALRIVR